jgi:multiple sugar transport system ATP-binding protein
MAQIELRNLSKRWGGFVGVQTMNLTVGDGEFLVLLGPSGCGKTTTMRMIAGLEDASDGDILIGGARVNDLEPKDRDIAMVFQSYGLYPTMTVYDNIRFPLKVRKIPESEHHDRVMRAAETVELTDFLKRKPAALSGGQRQRVALGPRHRAQAQGVPDGRTPVQPRRQAARVHPRPDQEPAPRAEDHHHLRHPRPDRGDDAGRPCRGDEVGRGAAGRHAPRHLRPPRQHLRRGLHRQPGDEPAVRVHPRGVFEGENARIPGFDGTADGPVTLGFRAEDAQIAPAGEIAAPVYSMELLGDSSMATVHAGGALVAIKAAKDFTAEIGAPIAARVPAAICHLFDATSGQRIARHG